MLELHHNPYIFGIEVSDSSLFLQVVKRTHSPPSPVPSTSELAPPQTNHSMTDTQRVLEQTGMARLGPKDNASLRYQVADILSGTYLEFDLQELARTYGAGDVSDGIQQFLNRLSMIGIDKHGHAAVITDANRTHVKPLLAEAERDAARIEFLSDHYEAQSPTSHVGTVTHDQTVDLHPSEYKIL